MVAGHTKLRNDLRRPIMEEIGYHTDVFSLDSIAGSQREYIHWLLNALSDVIQHFRVMQQTCRRATK